MKTFPFGQKRLEIIIHAISWFLIFFFPLMFTERGNEIDWGKYLRHGIVPLCCFIMFYANYLYLVPQYMFRNKWIKFLLLNVLFIACLAFGIHFGHEMLVFKPSRPDFDFKAFPAPPPIERWMFLGRHWVMLTLVAGLSTAIRVGIRLRHTEKRLVQSEREKTEAELKNLKSQLNPHFLLNTLNNIYALVAIDGHRAQETILELSRMLRYVLYENQSGKVPLEKELEFINNYISLMRIRLSKSVEVRVHLDAGEKPLWISPLIFISLIENAFKHGISPTEPSFINISICGHTDGKITCEIQNSNFPKNGTDKSGSGIGLTQVDRRLELSYPGCYEWNKGTRDNERTYISTLTIQTTES